MATEALLTERLRAEPHHLKHLPLIQQLLSDQRVATATLPGGLPMTAEQVEAIMLKSAAHWQAHGFGRWAWFDRVTGKFVGTGGVRLHLLEGMPLFELGYILRPECWGRGYATELARASVQLVFDELNLPDIVAWARLTNHASRHVMEKLGMRYERDIMWTDLPHAFYRITREEWISRQVVQAS